jgi:hypothetical protein
MPHQAAGFQLSHMKHHATQQGHAQENSEEKRYIKELKKNDNNSYFHPILEEGQSSQQVLHTVQMPLVFRRVHPK